MKTKPNPQPRIYTVHLNFHASVQVEATSEEEAIDQAQAEVEITDLELMQSYTDQE